MAPRPAGDMAIENRLAARPDPAALAGQVPLTSTFLLTWNPRVYEWRDLRRDIARLRKKGRLATDWSCARSKQLRKGDRVFLLRQGVEPRGLVGSGWAVSDWYEGPGWRRAGVPCHYVDLELDVLSAEPILPREALSHGVLAEMYWDTQVSGTRIPEKVARELERAWRGLARDRGL